MFACTISYFMFIFNDYCYRSFTYSLTALITVAVILRKVIYSYSSNIVFNK